MKKVQLEKLYMQAQNLLMRNKAKKAFKLFKLGANYGYQDSIFMLAYLYDIGKGTKTNKKRAKTLYKFGVKNKYASSMTNLAIIYQEEYKQKKMLKMFKKALRYNDGDASLEIARYYLQKANIKKAIKYLKVAINHLNITEDSREVSARYLKRLKKYKESK